MTKWVYGNPINPNESPPHHGTCDLSQQLSQSNEAKSEQSEHDGYP